MCGLPYVSFKELAVSNQCEDIFAHSSLTLAPSMPCIHEVNEGFEYCSKVKSLWLNLFAVVIHTLDHTLLLPDSHSAVK